MKLDGASLRLLRSVLDVFCEHHNVNIGDDLALRAADQLIKMMSSGEVELEWLMRNIEAWALTL